MISITIPKKPELQNLNELYIQSGSLLKYSAISASINENKSHTQFVNSREKVFTKHASKKPEAVHMCGW